MRRSAITCDIHHLVEDRLECHRVTAAAAGLEEITIAMPLPLIVSHRVITVIPCKNDLKLFEFNSFSFFRVALSFLNFADHSVVHGALFLSKLGGK